MELFDQLPCPALITDKGGNILTANQASLVLFQRSLKDIENKDLENLVTKASYILIQSHVFPTLFKEELLNEFFINIKIDKNKKLPAFININSVEFNGKKHYCWVFFVAKERADFERKLINIREQLVSVNDELDASNQALRHVNKELEQFSYMVSHDLKEPVRTMNTFASHLLVDIETSNEVRIKEDVHYIQAAATRMTRLIDDLLEYSRAGYTELNKSTISLSDLIADVQERLLTQIEESQATIITDIENDIVFADPLSFGLAIQNILQNSMKFRKSDTPVQISIHCKDNVNKGGVNVEIADNGIGIAEDMQAHIFEAFKKLHAQSEYSGTGIGLAIVAKIIQRHNGSIDVSSTLGRGSRFTIFLPNQ